MRTNPGALDPKGTLLLQNDGQILGFYLGQTYTMVRNVIIFQIMDRFNYDRTEALNFVDQNFTFIDGVETVGFTPLLRVKKVAKGKKRGRKKKTLGGHLEPPESGELF